MFTLTQAVSRVASRLNKNSNDTTVATRLKNLINDACLEKWHSYAWSFRWREYPLVLSPQVSSGTMTATNGSQTITASGTPFLSAYHVGAWIQFTGDSIQAWYRILAVNSTSSAVIEPAYQGTTGSAKAYYLCPTDYLLPTEISDIGTIKVTYGAQAMSVKHQLVNEQYYYPTSATGAPYEVSVFNQSQTLTTYTTGTLSGTVNTVTLTGVGTAWLTNVQPGDEVVISGDTNTYKVQVVNSDTSITLYNNLKIAASGATYTISRQFGKKLRFQPCPEQPYVIFIKGLRAYTPLINDADTNEMLIRYPHAVIESAVWREASSSPDPREDSLYQKSELLWDRAKGEDEQILPQGNNTPIYNLRVY
jgi:hypothetical protein